MEQKTTKSRGFLRTMPSRRSYFFKADSFPEVIVNPQRDNRALKDSAYIKISDFRAMRAKKQED